MASTAQQLEVGINADATGLIRATTQASTALSGLQQDLQKVDAAGDITITPEFRLDQVNKNIAMVRQALQKLDADRANPDVVIDSAQFLAQQRKLFNELNRLDKEKVEIEAGFAVDPATTGRFQSLVGDLTGDLAGGGVMGLTGALQRLGGSGAAAAGGVGAAATAVYGLGQQAADVETQIIRLDALTDGMGEELFGDLQQFAQRTPFALDEVTAAAQRLLAVGVDLQDLPGYLEDLGEVASVTPATLEQVATIFAQMEGKGKATFEELQQLAEAGVPVWQTLADSMGLTVAQVQELATQGELTGDTITQLRDDLGEAFGGTMARQAASFNGQMSSLKDSFAQIGQNLGTIVLPAMTDTVAALNDISSAAVEATSGMSEFVAAARGEDVEGDGWWVKAGDGLERFHDLISPDNFELEEVNRKAEELEGTANTLGGTFTNLGDAISKSLGITVPVDEFSDVFNNFASGVQGAIDTAVRETTFTADVQTQLNFLLDRADMLDSLRQLTSGKDAVQLPADLRIRDIGGLGDQQEQVIRTLSSFVAAGIEHGVDQGRLYAQAKKLIIKAGVDPSEADRVLRQFLGLKREKTIPVDANTDPAEGAVGKFVQRRTGKTIYVNAETGAAAAEIRELTRDEHKTIYTHIVQSGGRPPNAVDPDTGRSGGSSQRSSAMSAPATEGGTNQRLAPQSTPVKVYLDGAEIADKLELQTNRLATTTSVRRLP